MVKHDYLEIWYVYLSIKERNLVRFNPVFQEYLKDSSFIHSGPNGTRSEMVKDYWFAFGDPEAALAFEMRWRNNSD